MTRKPMVRMTTPKSSDAFILPRDKTMFSLPQPRSTDAPDDAGLVQVIGRHLHLHAVADGEPHEPFAHFAGNGRQHLMLVVQFDAEHCSGQDRQDAPFNFDVLFHESEKSARRNAAMASGK